MKLLLLALFLVASCKAGQDTRNSSESLNVSYEGNVNFHKDIQPIFESRCVACHACTDSPCGLKLDSWESIKKGPLAYNLLATERFTSVGDAELIDLSVLNPFKKNDPHAAVLKTSQNIATRVAFGNTQKVDLFSDNEMEYRKEFEYGSRGLSYGSDRICHADESERNQHLVNFPFASRMPLGLPGLSKVETQKVLAWTKAPFDSVDEARRAEWNKNKVEESFAKPMVESWERFLNRDTLKGQYIGRYLYEHFAGLRFFFEGSEPDRHGKPIFFVIKRYRFVSADDKGIDTTGFQEVDTLRAYDDPGGKVKYRFEVLDQAIAKKNHIPWTVSQRTLSHLIDLFEGGNYMEDGKKHKIEWGNNLPAMKYSKNYLVDFLPIPAPIRATFVNEFFHIMVNQMVRGPVCTGPSATYAIRDRFWVFHLKPSQDPTVLHPTFKQEPDRIRLIENNFDFLRTRLLLDYGTYRKHREEIFKDANITTDSIWKGEGHEFNKGSRVTVMRHGGSATMYTGLIGGVPETLWLLSYANAERIFYNLVVEYVPEKAINHQFITWGYMKRHRVEAENQFLSLLPKDDRKRIRGLWDTGSIDFLGNFATRIRRSKDLLLGDTPSNHKKVVSPDDPALLVLNKKIKELENTVFPSPRVADSLNRHPLTLQDGKYLPHTTSQPQSLANLSDFDAHLYHLTNPSTRKPGMFTKWIPSLVHIRIKGESGQYAPYTIMAHRIYGEHGFPKLEQSWSRHYEMESVSAFKGIKGDYAHMFFDIDLSNAKMFLDQLVSLESEADWTSLVNQFGISRDNKDFWKFYDWTFETQLKSTPVTAGRLDLLHYQTKKTFAY